MSDETPAERVSRFREHTNTTSSIRPPPDELWKEVGIESLLDKFHDENDSTPAVRKASHPRQIMSPTAPAQPWTAAARKGSDAAATVATAEGTFGRFSRVFANVFGGVLGKRKAGHTDAEPSVGASVEQARLDERKRQAEEAYHMAKEQGLLPAPKLFVRPGMAPRAWSADTPTRPRPPLTPRTPGSIVRSPSKKDLNKQKRLSKRVSSLEVKLASAKKELQSVLGNECFPAVPPLPQHLSHARTHARASPTPNTPHLFSDDAMPQTPSAAFAEGASASLPGNLAKKRKSVALVDNDANADLDMDYAPTTTAVASDLDMSDPEPEPKPEPLASPAPERQRTIKCVKSDASKRLKRTSSRLTRKVSRNSVKDSDLDRDRDDKIIVVKPGGPVPPVPTVPQGIPGKKVQVASDDGFGGLGHEIF
ncbi:hypothetical protein ST47_g4315 [Ascochyta rabiei]|uniref:Uncharacterized protein n=1 Tax=Didymella rabiei TaxID=5454 RepID=A0A163FXH5_DIDRA|nr:hypothetical protein ST47_g4315 [Ascochyta rabiei]